MSHLGPKCENLAFIHVVKRWKNSHQLVAAFCSAPTYTSVLLSNLREGKRSVSGSETAEPICRAQSLPISEQYFMSLFMEDCPSGGGNQSGSLEKAKQDTTIKHSEPVLTKAKWMDPQY